MDLGDEQLYKFGNEWVASWVRNLGWFVLLTHDLAASQDIFLLFSKKPLIVDIYIYILYINSLCPFIQQGFL